ncbi:D-3-phosphoglycerate dehydrogenase [Anaerobacterium chartisolvens]|uniref:D-3-phosphoglycerate dehydrogenase n=1 Tax=Anaerobacterium chartisolvens TaxID=1297424 RepID=A0A369AH32_9FIRM|nr:phosphoglycerate dehydrogenase [Anaerobacterium chartisolvens]RCX08672.1 D-3-phosphoglycerate dehydrogenase [Anaerobacterium chartisolvens]
MGKKVLVTATNYSKYCSQAKILLESEGFEIIENEFGRPMTFDELKLRVPDIYAVVAGVDTWNEEVFRIAPKLKAIARFGVGVDNIDLNKAKDYGIKVTNAKGMNSNAVAELAVGLILGAVRNIPYLTGSLKKGNWDRFVGREIAGKSVGLLGFGSIAQGVAEKLQGFGVKIYAFDKYPNLEKAKDLNVTMTCIEEILKSCDIVSLHLPSFKETYHIMGREQFETMKDGAYFVNTARGALVDEKALYQALKSGKLAGASTDVFEEEPAKPSNPLFELDNMICTPHTAAETYETYTTVSMATAQGIIDVFKGRTPQNLLNG